MTRAASPGRIGPGGAGAALAGWSYLVAWGALRAAELGHARTIGLALGAVAGVAAAHWIVRFESGAGEAAAPSPQPI